MPQGKSACHVRLGLMQAVSHIRARCVNYGRYPIASENGQAMRCPAHVSGTLVATRVVGMWQCPFPGIEPPKKTLRHGSCSPELPEPRRLTDKSLPAVIQEAWIQNVSTRNVKGLVLPKGLDGKRPADGPPSRRACGQTRHAVRPHFRSDARGTNEEQRPLYTRLQEQSRQHHERLPQSAA